MAKLIMNGKTEEVEDGDEIVLAAEKLGLMFGCYSGECGACKINVLKGEENLSELTEKEKAMGLTKTKRLACQCRIKSGEVEIVQD